MHRRRSTTIKGRSQIPGQKLGFRGRPDLLDAAALGIDRLESFDGASADGPKKAEAPLHETGLGAVDEDVDPAFYIGVGRKSMPATTPFQLDLVNQIVAVAEADALDGARKPLDHGGGDAAMQSDQTGTDRALESGEIQAPVDHLRQPMASRASLLDPALEIIFELILETIREPAGPRRGRSGVAVEHGGQAIGGFSGVVEHGMRSRRLRRGAWRPHDLLMEE